jgi:hypothetical protein
MVGSCRSQQQPGVALPVGADDQGRQAAVRGIPHIARQADVGCEPTYESKMPRVAGFSDGMQRRQRLS